MTTNYNNNTNTDNNNNTTTNYLTHLVRYLYFE